VREAFIKLAEVGLVEVRPQRGTFVMLISRREVENARFIREAIEVAVARKAAQEATADSIDGLNRLVAEQRVANLAGDVSRFLRFDEAFHQSLANSVGCDHAWRVLENLKAQMDRVRYLSMPDATPVETLIGQHQAIVDAIAAGSADRAEAAMREHLAEILLSLPRIAADRPEMFSDL
jgi:DNA-binding GntR family transcriptional regulator